MHPHSGYSTLLREDSVVYSFEKHRLSDPWILFSLSVWSFLALTCRIALIFLLQFCGREHRSVYISPQGCFMCVWRKDFITSQNHIIHAVRSPWMLKLASCLHYRCQLQLHFTVITYLFHKVIFIPYKVTSCVFIA